MPGLPVLRRRDLPPQDDDDPEQEGNGGEVRVRRRLQASSHPEAMTTADLTTEQKLAAVMAAQVKGGCLAFEGCVPEDVVGHAVYLEGTPDGEPPVPLSNILIDQDLLRAAFGEKMIPYGVSFHRPGELQKDAA